MDNLVSGLMAREGGKGVGGAGTYDQVRAGFADTRVGMCLCCKREHLLCCHLTISVWFCLQEGSF